MIILIKPNLLKSILFFIVSPGSKYSRNEIKEFTKLNNVILDESLTELINLKILFKKDRLFKINLENKIIQEIKKELDNKEINELPLKIKYLLIDILNQIQKIKKIENIILFGSYAKLIYHKNSDIDIAIIFKKEPPIKTKKKIKIIIKKISKKYKKEIQEHLFIKEDLKNKKDPLIKEIIQNGRKLIWIKKFVFWHKKGIVEYNTEEYNNLSFDYER